MSVSLLHPCSKDDQQYLGCLNSKQHRQQIKGRVYHSTWHLLDLIRNTVSDCGPPNRRKTLKNWRKFRAEHQDGCWLEHLPCKQKLQGWRFFSLEQTWLHRHLIAAPIPRREGMEAMELGSFVHNRRTKDINWNSKFLLDARKNFFPLRTAKQQSRSQTEVVQSPSTLAHFQDLYWAKPWEI